MVKQSRRYLYRIADLGLAVREVLIDAEDIALAEDIERVAAGRVDRGALLSGGSLGGALGGGGGGREEALSKAKGNGRRGRPEGEVGRVVLLVVAASVRAHSAGHRMLPRRSGNPAERRRRTATPHRQPPV